jgi:hypothetical protein
MTKKLMISDEERKERRNEQLRQAHTKWRERNIYKARTKDRIRKQAKRKLVRKEDAQTEYNQIAQSKACKQWIKRLTR